MTLTSSNGEQGIAAEKNSVEMIVTWAVIAVAVAAGVAIVGWLLRNRSHTHVNPLSRLVVGALGMEWADRTGADLEAVRSAALRDEPSPVRSQLASLIEDVEVGFEFNGAGPVRTSVWCKYADGTSATTATMDLPWEDVPQDVRAQFMRSGEKTLSRHWNVS